MKLTIDLETLTGYDDEGIATLLRRAIDDEIRAYVRRLAKELLKSDEKRLRTIVERAAKRDWRKVAAALEALRPQES